MIVVLIISVNVISNPVMFNAFYTHETGDNAFAVWSSSLLKDGVEINSFSNPIAIVYKSDVFISLLLFLIFLLQVVRGFFRFANDNFFTPLFIAANALSSLGIIPCKYHIAGFLAEYNIPG